MSVVTRMTRAQLSYLAAASWLLSGTALFVLLGAESWRSWGILLVTGFLPPLVLIGLVGQEPPLTIAEILHNTEVGL